MARRPFSVALTVGTGGHSANDIIGGRIQFYGVKAGRLQGAMVADGAAQNVAYVLVLLRSVPTNIADGDPYDLADADLKNIEAILSLPTTSRTGFTDNSVTLLDDLDKPIASDENDGDIWGFLYSTGTPTYAAATDVTVVIWVDQE